jgi:arylsulfatase A-like enzyme
MDAETQLLVVGIAAGALLVLAFGATLLLKSRQRRLVAESRSRLFEIIAQPVPPEQKIAQAQAFAAGLGCDKVNADRPRARGEWVNEESQVQAPEGEARGSRDYAELGDRVAAVLQAAEEAAEQIRADARAAADEQLEEAKREAKRVRVEADTEAKNTREAVESYATNHRREAEEKATKMLADAEGQARASREAAEAMAKRIEESARTLEEEVREQERMIRGRMQRYLAALRDVSGQIEDVLGETERGEQTLVEALDQRAQQTP